MAERKFAQGTKITSEKSENEIRNTLKKFGATKYAFYEDEATIGFAFDYEGRRVRISLQLPDPEADDFVYSWRGYSRHERTKELKLKSWQQECNRRWRALVLTVKAKLVSVNEGIRTFEQEFLYDIVIPNTNQTIGDWIAPQIEQSYLTGKLPPLLPGIGETSEGK
jgi:hypothetical protein